MSERETFVARWSRRKRSTQERETAKPAPSERPPEEPDRGKDALASAAAGGSPEPPALALPKLPPIESIAEESDIRAFLAPGVPPELTRAALRRAWSADPKIRDFIGLSENSWDFNDPSAIPGFGPLELTDGLRREIARIIGDKLDESTPDAPACASPNQERVEAEPASAQPTSPVIGPPTPTPALPGEQAAPVRAAQQDSSAPGPSSSNRLGAEQERAVPRRHGRALPR